MVASGWYGVLGGGLQWSYNLPPIWSRADSGPAPESSARQSIEADRAKGRKLLPKRRKMLFDSKLYWLK